MSACRQGDVTQFLQRLNKLRSLLPDRASGYQECLRSKPDAIKSAAECYLTTACFETCVKIDLSFRCKLSQTIELESVCTTPAVN